MKKRKTPTSILLASMLLAGASASSYGQISYSGGSYSENFDTLPTATVSGAISSVIGTQAEVTGLTGWSAAKVAGTGSSNASFVFDNGSGNSGALYNYGTTDTTDRALGVLASGSNALALGAEFVNNSGSAIESVTISFTAEFWRSSTSVKNVLSFAYGFSGGTADSSNYLTDTSLTAETQLDVVGPDPVSSNGLLDGNDPANQSVVTLTLFGLNWQPGQSLFIRWTDTNDGGSDAGLAIDNFSLTSQASTGSDVSRGSGNLWTPTSFGGNAFTADDTAVFDGSSATITVQDGVIAKHVHFVTDGYNVVQGSNGSLTVTGLIDVDSGVTGTIDNLLAGAQGITKVGEGTLTLKGSPSFSGDVTINSGTLAIDSDAALGNASGLILNGGTLQLLSPFDLGSSRTLSGSGTITRPSNAAFAINGNIDSANLTFTQAGSISFNGVTNNLTGLSVPDTVDITGSGSALNLSGDFTLGQTSGISHIYVPVDFGSGGDRYVTVSGGTLVFDNTLSIGATSARRLVKVGTGTLDLTSTTMTTEQGGVRLGVQGSSPLDGGTIVVDDDTDLGVAQLHFNTGVIQFTQPITSPIGLSFGGDNNGVTWPTLTGADVTLTGANGFYGAKGTSGDSYFQIDNTTTLTGDFSAPSFVGGYIEMNGSGKLILKGDASSLTNFVDVNEGLTLQIDGSFGSEDLYVFSGATLSGSGTIVGKSSSGVALPSNRVAVEGELAPGSSIGVLSINGSLELYSGAQTTMQINGTTRGLEYDGIDMINTVTDGSQTYTLTYGGTLTLDFGSLAINGVYDLFNIGENVTTTGNFASVYLTGAHTDSMSYNGTAWTVTDSTGTTFSLDMSTGDLTVTGGSSLSGIAAWRSSYFQSSANDGDAANMADPDGDGIANLVEYATGSDPLVSGTAPAAIGESNDGHLTLTFNRIADSSLTYRVMAADDLGGTWSEIWSSTGSENVAGSVTVTDTVLITAQARRFLRLEVNDGL